MVNFWSGYIMIENAINDVSKHPITATATSTAVKDVILRGVLPFSRNGTKQGTTTNWYCRTDASDISGYRKLLSSNADTSTEIACSKPQADGSCAIEEFSTDAGAMDGVNSSNETTTFRIRAKWVQTGGVSPASHNPRVQVYVYHRAVDTTETKIGFYYVDITSSYQNFATAITLNKSWGTNERLVIKFRFVTSTDSPL
jgi:RecJ-like exonuclease